MANDYYTLTMNLCFRILFREKSKFKDTNLKLHHTAVRQNFLQGKCKVIGIFLQTMSAFFHCASGRGLIRRCREKSLMPPALNNPSSLIFELSLHVIARVVENFVYRPNFDVCVVTSIIHSLEKYRTWNENFLNKYFGYVSNLWNLSNVKKYISKLCTYF